MSSLSPMQVDHTNVTKHSKLLVIAGPCQIESESHCMMMAERILEAVRGLPIELVFKSSFDKANRTSVAGARGVGIESGLGVLQKVRSDLGLPVLTDVHEVAQVERTSEVVDILQVPAFLCRQTDLLLAVGASGKPVNLKKGQFLHPADMKYAAEKVIQGGAGRSGEVLLCERGSCFGYRDLVVDMRSFIIMRELGYRVIFDATHSTQRIGGAAGSSGGSRVLVAPLARAAAAVGIDGLFIECHEDPDRAPSDGPSMLPIQQLRAVLESVCRIWEQVRELQTGD